VHPGTTSPAKEGGGLLCLRAALRGSPKTMRGGPGAASAGPSFCRVRSFRADLRAAASTDCPRPHGACARSRRQLSASIPLPVHALTPPVCGRQPVGAPRRPGTERGPALLHGLPAASLAPLVLRSAACGPTGAWGRGHGRSAGPARHARARTPKQAALKPLTPAHSCTERVPAERATRTEIQGAERNGPADAPGAPQRQGEG
jgi:hypothetical protein